ncbi:hypothetical protein QFZ36_000876 [Pseudarthrobacter siccitolerans]|uniref:Membrane protein ArfC n=1 Tax=Pseudarthrobacter siccitolerans TaxID=861266 RepID=A0ABU0PH72_9MICC|nr:hypothetical protein [Pseudarthrobacter siccitolerans]MDQ0673315.1 hypothetical protein [Pseudarthrobacter siccitolerans]
MEAVFLIILLVVLAGVVWWRLNAKKSAAAREAGGQAERTRADGGTRTDGALSGGSAAASAEAAGTSGIAGAAGFGRPAEPAAPTTADEPAGTAARAHDVPAAGTQRSGAGSSSVGTAAAADSGRDSGSSEGSGSVQGADREERRIQDQAEWETQWSEASGSAPAHEGEASRQSAAHREATAQREGAAATTPVPPAQSGSGAVPSETGEDTAGASQPVHHTEYTAPHAPTLPGAETAAVEEPGDTGIAGAAEAGNATASSGGAGTGLPGDAAATETQDRTQSSALVETGSDHMQDQPAAMPSTGTEPAGHLAAEEPYGMGSASAASDGSGPADYTVKADAGAMVYYEEGHPEYEQTRADVWFESPAHAEAAGFRAPRRRRI